jgi:hypothetical protein
MNASGFGEMSANAAPFVPKPSNMGKRMRANAPAYLPPMRANAPEYVPAGAAAAAAGGAAAGAGGGLEFNPFEMVNPANRNAAIKRYVNNYKLPNLKKGLTDPWEGGRKKRRSRKTKRSYRSRSRRHK